MFDSLAISAVRDEILMIGGARVQRVVQVDALTVGLELYLMGHRHWLLGTADPVRSGLWFVEGKLGQSPDPPSPLLLLMRKHLVGAVLTDVIQPAFERVVRLVFESHNQGDVSTLALIVEATGRLGNLILVNDEEVVLEAVKRVPPSINRQRAILPRRPYVGPPPQAKASPPEADTALLAEALAGAKDPASGLVGAVRGISPQAAREVVHRAGETTPERVLAALNEVVGERRPSIGVEDGRAVAFAPYQLTHLPTWERMPSLSAAAARYFGEERSRSPLAQAQATLRGEVEAQRGRETRRLEALERELGTGEEVERLRESGELIYAYVSQIAPKASALELDDRSIPLDPDLTAVENAQAYFERYTRLRDARKRLPGMIEEARARVAYLGDMLIYADLARTTDEVNALRRELAPAPQKAGGKTAQPARAEPLRVKLDGHTLFVGRSARQNDTVTFELARPNDLWLHARGLAGAHVILRVDSGKPDAAIVERAAQVAAFHSEARTSGRVPVDVTERRHVRKIKGAPGAVTYSGERTIHVAPRDYQGREAP